MILLSGLGIVLSLVFGCLLLALVVELYYLLWWKKQTTNTNNNTSSNTSSNRVKDDYGKELFYLFCRDKLDSTNNPSSNPNVANRQASLHDPDVELGLESTKDHLVRTLDDDGIDSELMRLHNLGGPPRFLFTINEETNEDLESNDRRSKKGSRTRSLSDLIMTMEAQSPMNGDEKMGSNGYDNPLFEVEIDRLRCSPPPKFKFLRDAEEKLYRRLIEEGRKSGILRVNNGKNEGKSVGNGGQNECKSVGNGDKDEGKSVGNVKKTSLYH